MPFGFGRKKDEAAAVVEEAGLSGGPRPVRFQGYTEDWRLDGEMLVVGRLLDLLNGRDAIPLRAVRWAPVEGNTALESAPGIQSVDPYDLIIVIAGVDTLEAQTEGERSAHRIHKVRFEVALVAPPFRVVGSVHLYPGAVPETLLERGTQMFAAITDAVVQLGDTTIDTGTATTVLVNRFYLRDVSQVDLATGLPYSTLPAISEDGAG